MSTRAIKTALRELDLSGADPFLFIAWKERKNLAAATVRLHPRMMPILREIAVSALDSIAHREMREYAADAHLVRREQGMWVPAESVNDDSLLIKAIDLVPDAPEITARAAAEKKVAFYAIGFFEGEDLTLFVKRRYKLHQTGPKAAIGLAAQALRPLSEPIMVIENTVDFIWRHEGLVAFDESVFDGLVKDPQDIAAELALNVEAISVSLPFAAETSAQLGEYALKRPMLRRKIRSIVERGHLAAVTLPQVAEKLRLQGFSPEHYIANGAFAFDMARALWLFRFLAEGTYLGAFTGDLYGVDGPLTVPPEVL